MTLEPELEVKLNNFKAFILTLGENIEKTAFGVIGASTPIDIFGLMLIMYTLVSAGGKKKVGPEDIKECIKRSCKEHSGKEPEEIMDPDQLKKLTRYVEYFVMIITKKMEAGQKKKDIDQKKTETA